MNIEQAANTLELILDRIGESIDDDAKLKIRQEMIEFKRSLPWEPEFAELRRIAQETFDDLGRSINARTHSPNRSPVASQFQTALAHTLS